MDERNSQWKLDPITRLIEQVSRMEEDVKSIRHSLDDKYVTQDQFEPVKQIVYGLVAVVLLGVVAALISLVIIRR